MCTYNSIRVDYVTESPNLSEHDRSVLPLPGPVRFVGRRSRSSEQLAETQVERKDMRQQLATAYDSCVRTSFASQLPTMVDRNMAIDQAFVVCQTEEKKLQDVGDGAISAHRNTLKEELLRR